jgi:prevent-host-death family protein
MVFDHSIIAFVETISISKFKATCLAVLERVRRTGKPVRVTRFGEAVAEVVPPSPESRPRHWIGSMKGTGFTKGEIISPALRTDEWEALKR